MSPEFGTYDDDAEGPSAAIANDDASDWGAAEFPADRADADVLEEIRERKTYGKRAWQDVRSEGQKDVMCVAGDVWEALDPAGLAQRQAASRPAIAPDELGQYLNQVANDVRQNKREIKATPVGLGATDKTATFRQNLIRQIQYESNAQRDVYSPIFEDALQRGYGFGRIVAKRTDPLSKNQKLGLEAFINPDAVTVDPDGAILSPDCARIQWAFIDEGFSVKQFKRDFPTARVVDFTDEHRRLAPDWVQGERITVAEYWTVETVRRRVVFLKVDPSRGWYEYKLPRKPLPAEIDSFEWVDEPHVYQYLTNGIELLAKKGAGKKTRWPGTSIPIASCFGKVLYVQTGSGTQRRTMSMTRLMRAPIMAYSYTRTCQVEVIGSVPRATWVGYEGQFRGHEEEWAKANHEPVPFLVAKPYTEATGGQVLPLPTRNSWDPPLQNLEMQAEAFRRSIQAAAGVSPLPTDAQRVNQKSGKALDRIESSGQKGSYHFVDHLDGMITRFGVLLDEQIAHRYDTMRKVTVRKPNDEVEDVTINDPSNPESVKTDVGTHDITISVGPAYTDERAAASDFADTIVGNEPLMQLVGPQKAQELIAEAIRLKSVGPIGDHMAEIIDPKPPEPGEPPTPEQVQRMQAEMQGVQQENAGLKQAIETDQAKQAGAVEKAKLDVASREKIALAEIQSRETIALAQLEAKRADNETKLAVAELGAKVERLALFLEERARLGVQDHETRMAGDRMAHESAEAREAREAAERTAADGRAHEAAMAEQAAAQAAEAGA